MNDEARPGGGPGEVRAVWSRRKWLAIPAFLFPLTAVMSLAVFMPGLYKSTAPSSSTGSRCPRSLCARR